jgi:hypothetical protein
MNKLLKISYLVLAFLFFLNIDASAQIKPSKKKTEEPTQQEDAQPSTDTKTDTKKKSTKKTTKKTDEYFDESGGFKHRLWYGGNINFNLNSLNGGNLFAIGITPMVGYKIIGGLSAGPRLGITYTSIKSFDTGGGVSSVGVTNYSAGVFSRFKAFKNFFAHAEFEYVNEQYPSLLQDQAGNILIQLDSNRKPIKNARESRNNTYAGLGYSSGEIFSYEIMALYNFSIPKGSLEQPLGIRAGFTYKF